MIAAARPARPGAGTSPDAIIVGGGIAGIAAALRLAERGHRVTLLETRRKLGGRATSFVDPRTGEILDNCQHVALRCCTNYIDLLERLGVADQIRWDEAIHWVEAGGRVSTMRAGILPAPAHLTESFATARFLTVPEKAQVARAMIAILGADRSRAAERTFGAWLRDEGQSERVIRLFWSPVIVSACNLDVDRVSAGPALHVFQDGFLAHRDAWRIGVSRAPLLKLYDRAGPAIEAAGGSVRLGASVRRIAAGAVETAHGETLRAARVICATPPERAVRIVEPALQRMDGRFDAMRRIEHSPILGAHLFFDRPVMELPHATLVDRPTQWIFRKDDAGAQLHAVISAADDWMSLSEEEIGRRVMKDVRACFPAAEDAALARVRAVKEKRATFAPTPEVEARRVANTGPSGVILAGDYTRTGWPATMEGATRSGCMAAAAALGESASGALRPALRAGRLYRALART